MAKVEKSNPRSTVTVSTEGRDYLKRLADWTGQPQQTVLDRLLTWACALEDVEGGEDMIGAIVGALPLSRRADFVALVLRDLEQHHSHADGSLAMPQPSPRNIAAQKTPQPKGKRPPTR